MTEFSGFRNPFLEALALDLTSGAQVLTIYKKRGVQPPLTPKTPSNATPQLAIVTEPDAYFRELIMASLGKNKIQPRPETEFYLVKLLQQFMKPDSLQTEALAILLRQAVEEPHPQARLVRFRQIGDVSLYVAGYFQDSLSRKLVDVDYYIGMGGVAYRQAASLVDAEALQPVYNELSENFSGFVDVLAEVSDQTTPKTEKDILRMYELWVRTGSERAARALQEAGIVPNSTIKKDNVQ